MRAGPCTLHLVALDAVEQQPIRFNVQIAQSVPVSAQGMITVFQGQDNSPGQRCQNTAQLRTEVAEFPN